jgi:nitroreductase
MKFQSILSAKAIFRGPLNLLQSCSDLVLDLFYNDPSVMKEKKMTRSLEEIIKSRRSIREFSDRVVDPVLVKHLVETATWAPSANNRQVWRFHLLNKPAIIEETANSVENFLATQVGESGVMDELMEGYRRNFLHFRNAPAILCFSYKEPNQFQKEHFNLTDENQHMTGELLSLALVLQNFLLLAEDAGLGTLVMTAPLVAADEIRRLFKIPRRYNAGAFVCLGWPMGEKTSSTRKPVEDVFEII